jgi:endonuclease/exonuclease/phosphatase family metal-dependent hydrolase
LHQLRPDKYDIAVTQEPHINYLGNAQATPHWITVYPIGHLDRHQKTRALIMMNRLTISSNAWTQLDIDSPDVVGIQINGEQGTLRIINIYNDCTHDESMEAVEKYMTAARRRQGGERAPIRYVWMGDFNRHSPMWDDGRNVHLFTTQNLEAAGRLTDMAARHGMTMALPPGLPTLKAMATGNETRVDNIFCDEGSMGLIDICDTRPAWRPVKTDHYPIICRIRMEAASNKYQPRRDY